MIIPRAIQEACENLLCRWL